MIYLSFIGNHDAISATGNYGAVTNIFMNYKDEINSIFFFVTPKTDMADYTKIANENAKLIREAKSSLEIEFININLQNPVDYDLVYPNMLNEVSNIVDKYKLHDEPKIVNITSGTPTMAACWILLSQSGIINNAKLVQSFEKKFARDGKTTVEVNFNIDDFPQIKAPAQLKRKVTILSREIKSLKDELEINKLKSEFQSITGNSKKILEIKDQLLYEVNETTNVLIIGERGTGKGIIAKAIWEKYHNANDKELITYDCSHFSSSVIESHLFGHVKGAFTDAHSDHKGIFEVNSNRMIFLDEIGNLSLQGQSKLLRILQDKEYTRLGDTAVRKTNVQIIAATNKNINDESLFAQDLKDRFNEVIELPSLRERKEDIPLLIAKFVNHYNDSVKPFSPVVLEDKIIYKLISHNWPDNIRGLENWINRLLRRLGKGGEIKYSEVPEKYFRTFEIEPKYDLMIPSLPLPVPIDEYIELIREAAREKAEGNNSEVDRLLKQKIGTEKVRQHRKRDK